MSEETAALSGSLSGKRVAVIVLTLDEEINLPDCIASLDGLDHDLYVVDSGSKDRTKELACAASATVFSHPFENYAKQRNWAQAQLPPSYRWVLHLDADERLTPELAAEIRTVVGLDDEKVNGWMMRQRTVFLGRWIRHGAHYPVWHLRLFRPACGRCEDRKYDQHFIVEGVVRRMDNDYIDVIASDLATWTTRHLRWVKAEVDELSSVETPSGASVSPSLFGSPIQRRRWLRQRLYNRAPPFARAVGYWAYRYFFRLGFLDGVEGLIFHFLQGLWLRMMIDIELWQRSRQDFKDPPEPHLGL